MSHFSIRAALGACLVFANVPAQSAPGFDVTVTLSGVRSSEGAIRAVLCTRSERFPNACTQNITVAAAAGKTLVVFRAVPAGTYAFAAFHDQNNNGRIDVRGPVPQEGLAFGNDAIGRNNVPEFAASAFSVVQTSAVGVKMRYLAGR